MIDVRPQILEKLAQAFSYWYGNDGYFRKHRNDVTHLVHSASTILYHLEQTLPEGDVRRARLQRIRNRLEELMGDYAYDKLRLNNDRYSSLRKNPMTRNGEVVRMVVEGAFVE